MSERAFRSLERFILETPPLYLVTATVVAGDALGNAHCFASVWLPVLLGVLGAVSFLMSRPFAGLLVTLIALAAATTLPVARLLEPPTGPGTLSRFPDGSKVKVEGYLIHGPERVEGERDRIHLYLQTERAGPSADLSPTVGLIRVTTEATMRFLSETSCASARVSGFPAMTGIPASSTTGRGFCVRASWLRCSPSRAKRILIRSA